MTDEICTSTMMKSDLGIRTYHGKSWFPLKQLMNSTFVLLASDLPLVPLVPLETASAVASPPSDLHPMCRTKGSRTDSVFINRSFAWIH